MKSKLIIVMLLAMLVASALPVHSVRADPGWDYRRPITISNTSGSALSNYQVRVELTTSTMGNPYSNVNADGSDLRFTDEDNTVKYDYWIASSWSNTGTSNIWVEVSSIPTGDSTMYMWYGNSAADSESDSDATFAFFDDFEGSSLDTNKWNAGPGLTYSVSDSKLHVTGCPEDNWGDLFGFESTWSPLQNGFVVSAKDVYWDDGDSNSAMFLWGVSLSDGTNFTPIYEAAADSWDLFTGSKKAKIDSNSYSTANNNLAQPGTAQFAIVKNQNNITQVVWNGTTVLGPYSSTTTISELWLLVNRNSTNQFASELTIDRIFVRNFVSPEPTNSVGSEQDAGPAEPVPELPPIVMLSIGLTIIGGYLWFRQRKGVVTAV